MIIYLGYTAWNNRLNSVQYIFKDSRKTFNFFSEKKALISLHTWTSKNVSYRKWNGNQGLNLKLFKNDESFDSKYLP